MSPSASASCVAGGNLMHRPRKNVWRRKTEHEKDKDALIHTNIFLGAERLVSIKEKWSTLDTTRHGPEGDGDLADGIFTCLQKCGFSHIEIGAALKCGSGRLTLLSHTEIKPGCVHGQY